MINLSLYYYNQKHGWSFLPSKMNKNRQVISSTIFSLDAISIMQDVEPPFIRKVYPENGGKFHYKDLRTISIIADDFFIHVYAWRFYAYNFQYVVFMDIWRQY